MTEYIERQAAKAAFGRMDTAIGKTTSMIIDSVPAADVAPVVHGRWIKRGGKRFCSECKERACVTRDMEDFWYTKGTDYCPNCGAKMDKEAGDAQ